MGFDEFKQQVMLRSFPGELREKELLIRAGKTSIPVIVTRDPAGIRTQDPILIPLDYIYTMPQKVVSILQSKLGLNKIVFARSCHIKKIDKNTAEQFLDRYHVMRSTNSAFNYGLFFKEELIAAASFSKGRKMNRLSEAQRSFELIRFCCEEGITVTGGLTKLVKNFCREKQAGDIMTYVDKQWSDGRAFITAGFKKHSETEPNYFLVDKQSFERKPAENASVPFDPEKFYLTRNSGNIKLIYTPDAAI